MEKKGAETSWFDKLLEIMGENWEPSKEGSEQSK